MFNLTLTKSVKKTYQPNKLQIKSWLTHTLVHKFHQINIEVLIVDQNKSQQLNNQYRKINKPTNVIALEYQESRDTFSILTGELILCDSIIVAEAQAQGKTILGHYTHMLVHGMLHLQGFDHQTKSDAEHMEALEVKILNKLGVSCPY